MGTDSGGSGGLGGAGGADGLGGAAWYGGIDVAAGATAILRQVSMSADPATAGTNGLAGEAGPSGPAGQAGTTGGTAAVVAPSSGDASFLVVNRALADLGVGWTADPTDEVAGAIAAIRGGGMDADSSGIPAPADRWLSGGKGAPLAGALTGTGGPPGPGRAGRHQPGLCNRPRLLPRRGKTLVLQDSEPPQGADEKSRRHRPPLCVLTPSWFH